MIGQISKKNYLFLKDEEMNTIKITYRGETPEEIARILDGHLSNYQKYLSYQFKEDAIKQFLVE